MDNVSGLIYERLTDETIDSLSQNRVITSYGDFNLKRGSRTVKDRLYPIVGGVYDSALFGSIYIDTCNCGQTDTIGSLCPKCGSRVLSLEERYKRYARIELDYYYMMCTKIQGMIDLLLSLPLKFEEAAEFFGFNRISKSSTPMLLDLCQFNYDEESNQIFVSPVITDESKASYEGLLKIIESHFPDYLSNYKSLINKKILVTPAIYRAVSYDPYDPVTNLKIPYISAIFQNCVYVKEYIKDQLKNHLDPNHRILIKALARKFYSGLPYQLSDALQPSKQNLLRALYSDRLDNSGRAPIVGDTSLKIDEVMIPIHLAYEICKMDFISYLSNKLGVNLLKAEVIYKEASKSTLDLFREYAPTRRVLVNRPPTLHRYNIMSFKMFVTDDPAIHFPITSVSPFAGDFDGDAMSFFLVPKQFNDLVDKNASPKTQLRYESTGDFIWQPNQEMLYGLTMSTKVDPVSDITKLKKYNTIEDLQKDFDDQVIEYPTDIIIYQDKVTSYARVKLGDIIGDSIDDLYKGTFITSENISILLSYLYELDNFTEVYQKVIEFALEVITLEGATVPTMSDLLSSDYSKFSEEMKNLIVKAKKDPKYNEELELKYKNFINEKIKNIPEDIKKRFKWSGRIKIQQVTDMICPQFVIDDHGDYYLTENSLAKGFTEDDIRRHATNNRSILQMKQNLTPNAGYANRQLIFPGQGIKFYDNKGEDTQNPGIWIPKNKAEGRTTIDGEIVEKSDSTELIKVRSFITSNQKYITPDLISRIHSNYSNDTNIGLKITSSIAGSFTQKALSLKHVGVLKQLDPQLRLIAKKDCLVTQISSDLIRIKIGNKFINHYVPTDFNISTDKIINAGEPIGFCSKLVGPGVSTEFFIDLLGATSTEDISHKGREKQYHICFSPVEGVIHYTNEYVKIGGFEFPREKDVVYYYLEGETVPKYARICNGVLNCAWYSDANNGISVEDYYGCFRANFIELLPQIVEYAIEYVFTIINSKDEVSGHYDFTGVKEKVKVDKSIITNLSFENQAKSIENILVEEKIKEDNKADIDLFNKFYLDILSENL